MTSTKHIHVDLDWVLRASRLPGKSLHLGLALWCLQEKQQKSLVALGNIPSQEFGLDRYAKYRALNWLEEAGLVMVERRPGRSPAVTLLYTPIRNMSHD